MTPIRSTLHSSRPRQLRPVLACCLALFCWLSVPAVGQGAPGMPDVPVAPRNLVLMVSDGCGPASFTLARTASGEPLRLDRLLVGSAATASADSHITDSAASATALACTVTTDNLVIGMTPDGRSSANLMELVQARGFRTGVLSTTRVTHATVACFSAHIMNREDEQAIALQQLDSGLDLLLGGGASRFLPRSAENVDGRVDGRDLLAELQADASIGGWQLVRDATGLAGELRLPLLGLFTRSHMAFSLDRNRRREPSLADMTRVALGLLSAGDEPFVLVIEGGRIDHAGHDNDAAAHLHDILAYDAAVAVVHDFLVTDGKTLLVSVSDHETGGLGLGRNRGGEGRGNWNPDALWTARHSLEFLCAKVLEAEGGESPGDPSAWVHALEAALRAEGGVQVVLPHEHSALVAAVAQPAGDPRDAAILHAMSQPLAREAGVQWTTFGHTAVDVPLFAAGPGADGFAGHHTLVDVGRLLRVVLGLESR